VPRSRILHRTWRPPGKPSRWRTGNGVVAKVWRCCRPALHHPNTERAAKHASPPSAAAGRRATGRCRTRCPTPTSSVRHPAGRADSTDRTADPVSAGTGSSPPISTGHSRSPSPAPAASRPAQTPTESAPAGTTDHTAPIARGILGALRRIRRQIQRPQHPHPLLQHGHRPAPPDPFRDHRRRHRRPLPQQLPDLWLNVVHDRALQRPPITRRRLRRQRPPHRVPPDTKLTTNRPNRHSLSPTQPTDLRPVLHAQHLPIIRRVQIQVSIPATFSCAVDTGRNLSVVGLP
jgi:hypothetical protein